MRLGSFQIAEPLPDLREPHALAVLRPWIDAGNAGTLAINRLEARYGAKEVGRLARPGNFFDFTRYRPMLYWQEGVRQISIPNTIVNCAKREGASDFVFLHLLEPHMLGELYSSSVLLLLQRLGVKRYCLIGSMYDMVPHTRPLLVSGGAEGNLAVEDLERAKVRASDYEGPGTICHLISQGAIASGIETMTIITHLPQYTELEEDYVGQMRLMEVLQSMYGIEIDEADIQRAEKQTMDIDDEVNRNPRTKEVVSQLEAYYDVRMASGNKEEMPQLSPEIEKFLKEIEKRFNQG